MHKSARNDASVTFSRLFSATFRCGHAVVRTHCIMILHRSHRWNDVKTCTDYCNSHYQEIWIHASDRFTQCPVWAKPTRNSAETVSQSWICFPKWKWRINRLHVTSHSFVTNVTGVAPPLPSRADGYASQRAMSDGGDSMTWSADDGDVRGLLGRKR